MTHNESCRGCKRVFIKTLEREFGEVIDQWSSGWPCRIDHVLSLREINNTTVQSIEKIFRALQKYRGHENFVRAKKLPQCDYYIKSLNCLIEIDESQHFTTPRGIALSLYPTRLKPGFDKKEWIKKCQDLNRHDNHPLDRDEKRAWYDTLRDIIPPLFGMAPTIRIFAKDLVACEERPGKIIELLKSTELNKSRNLIIRKESKMHNYSKTIAKNHREYTGKKLLLANKDRDGLFRDNGSCVEVEIKRNGDLSTCRFQKNGKRENLTDSLRKIGQDKLGLKDPSVKQMLKYLVIPEMEIERIFNSLRYKYLFSLENGDYEPQDYITSDCNNLFKALIGRSFRGIKKENLHLKHKKIFKGEGFSSDIKINIDEEERALDFIIQYIRNNYFNSKDCPLKEKQRIYRELIAIKPGFHEVFMDMQNGHGHKNGLKSQKNCRRNIVFKMIHNIYKTSRKFDLSRVNNEINVYRYLTYAPCNITEGPFTYRKNICVSYFKELNKASLKNDLKDNFMILDYWDKNINTNKKLDKFLGKAKKFCCFI